jgi:hypothetical protein
VATRRLPSVPLSGNHFRRDGRSEPGPAPGPAHTSRRRTTPPPSACVSRPVRDLLERRRTGNGRQRRLPPVAAAAGVRSEGSGYLGRSRPCAKRCDPSATGTEPGIRHRQATLQRPRPRLWAISMGAVDAAARAAWWEPPMAAQERRPLAGDWNGGCLRVRHSAGHLRCLGVSHGPRRRCANLGWVGLHCARSTTRTCGRSMVSSSSGTYHSPLPRVLPVVAHCVCNTESDTEWHMSLAQRLRRLTPMSDTPQRSARSARGQWPTRGSEQPEGRPIPTAGPLPPAAACFRVDIGNSSAPGAAASSPRLRVAGVGPSRPSHARAFFFLGSMLKSPAP